MSDRSSTLVSRSAMEMAFALLTMAFGATVISGALEFSIGWGEIGPEAGYFPFRDRHPHRPGLLGQPRPGRQAAPARRWKPS